MPNSQKDLGECDSDPWKGRQSGVSLPTPPVMIEQDYGLNGGERIIGLAQEYSGWDVYNNEARKVDAELVKDWTSNLNSLLIFVRE